MVLLRSTVTVIIPAYNEEETIGDVLDQTIFIMDSLHMPYEIIVVDDGSTDKTGEVASNYKVNVLSNEKNYGKGYSFRKALKYSHGEIIVTIDSDGEHKPKEIPDLLYPILQGFDLVAGSRFLGHNDNVTPKLNKIGNIFFNMAIIALTGKTVTDSQTGFRAAKADVLRKMNLRSNGYEIETEITVKGLINGFSYRELPISCERRRYNASKIRLLPAGTSILKTILLSSFLEIEH